MPKPFCLNGYLLIMTKMKPIKKNSMPHKQKKAPGIPADASLEPNKETTPSLTLFNLCCR